LTTVAISLPVRNPIYPRACRYSLDAKAKISKIIEKIVRVNTVLELFLELCSDLLKPEKNEPFSSNVIGRK
jgi:hypothetical protein